jgi:hypothetical protein
MHACCETVKGAIPEHHFLQPCRGDPWLQMLYADLKIAAFRIIERRKVLRQMHGLP